MADIAANIHTKAEVFLGDTLSSALETKGDHDWIKITLVNIATYTFYLSFLNTGSLTKGDSTLAIRDATGHLVPGMFDDDGGVGRNSFLSFTPSISGTYFIDIGEHGNNNTGAYSLVVLDRGTEVDKQLTDGADDYTGLAGERILGGKGADNILIGAGVDALGEQGNDTILGNGAVNTIAGGLGNDILGGNDGSDSLFGDAGNDILSGDNNEDFLFGGAGSDHIDGGSGGDYIEGGSGKDFLTGGADAVLDRFSFLKVSDSRAGASRDVITDFDESPDIIDLGAIDAKSGTAANDDFTFIGTTKFGHHKGELRFRIDVAHNLTLVQGDVNGDGKADIEIQLTGQHVLNAFDFS